MDTVGTESALKIPSDWPPVGWIRVALSQALAPVTRFQIPYKYNTNTRPKRVGPLSHGHHLILLLHLSPLFITSPSSSLYLFFLTHVPLHSSVPTT